MVYRMMRFKKKYSIVFYCQPETFINGLYNKCLVWWKYTKIVVPKLSSRTCNSRLMYSSKFASLKKIRKNSTGFEMENGNRYIFMIKHKTMKEGSVVVVLLDFCCPRQILETLLRDCTSNATRPLSFDPNSSPRNSLLVGHPVVQTCSLQILFRRRSNQ